MPARASSARRFTRWSADGVSAGLERQVAGEEPVAIELNGLGYAVLMATPADMVDLAYGFVFAERLIDTPDQIIDVTPHSTDRGTLLRISLSPDCHDGVADRVRHRVSESSCGLCGIENLDQALRPLRRIDAVTDAGPGALFRAADALRAHQPLNRETGAVHAAALCSSDGAIRLVREDVGRHNAFDKLIGAMHRGGLEWDRGFALLSSRCSYELVEKAVLANCPLLATLSAATGLALDRASAAGLPLRTLIRADALLAS